MHCWSLKQLIYRIINSLEKLPEEISNNKKPTDYYLYTNKFEAPINKIDISCFKKYKWRIKLFEYIIKDVSNNGAVLLNMDDGCWIMKIGSHPYQKQQCLLLYPVYKIDIGFGTKPFLHGDESNVVIIPGNVTKNLNELHRTLFTLVCQT